MNPANLVTLARVPLALLFTGVYPAAAAHGGSARLGVALAVVVAIELTDLFDGMLARRLGCVTDFGKLVDPFCDSFARLCVFFALAAAPLAAGGGPLLPLGVPVALLLRDLSVAFMRTVAATRGLVVAARPSGKLKAVVQGPAAIALLAAAVLCREPATLRAIAGWIALPVVLVTLGSMLDYLVANRAVFAEPGPGAEG